MAPLIIEDIQTDIPILVDIGMEHFCLEDHLGRLVRVVLREVHFEDEDAALPGCIGRPVDYCVPF